MNSYSVLWADSICQRILGLGVIVTTSLIGNSISNNVEASSYYEETANATHTTQNYKMKSNVLTSISSWNQHTTSPSQVSIMDVFNDEMDDFWRQVHQGEFEFSSEDIVLADKILKLHPDVRF